MEFIKNIELLGSSKKHTENKFWNLGKYQTIRQSVERKEDEYTKCIDFQDFDKLIMKMDYEQKVVYGK